MGTRVNVITARTLLTGAALVSGTALSVLFFQSLDLWRQVIRHKRFENVSGPESIYEFLFWVLVLVAPISVSLYAKYRWHLRLRGFTLFTVVFGISTPVYAAVCIAVLLGYSAVHR